MGLTSIFKKNKIPDELPDLGIEENVESPLKKEVPEDSEIVIPHIEAKEPAAAIESQKPKEDSEKPKQNKFYDKSFFTELQGDILKEIEDLNSLEKWYKNKFMPEDIVTEMRSYWENKKTGPTIKVIGKDFQERISEKIASLQSLEKEWQDIYFNLVEKEEEIKEKERELKKILKEFIEICKRKKSEK
jgi:hypothetical protein